MLDLEFEEGKDNFSAMQATTYIQTCTWWAGCNAVKFNVNAVADNSVWNEVLDIQAGTSQY